MGKILKGLLVLAIVLFMGIGVAEAGDYNYWVRVVDQAGNEITSGLRVNVCTNDSLTASTVYSDSNRTALSNDSMLTTLGPNDAADGGFDPGSDAVAKWWGPSTSYSLYVTDGYYWDRFDDITVTDHLLVFVGKNLRKNDGTFDDTQPGRMIWMGEDVYMCTSTSAWSALY